MSLTTQKNPSLQMRLTQIVRCPNCGSQCQRHYFTNNQLVQTECSECDYLMVNCSRTGKVVEAYAPGINPTCC
ncbi:MAG: replication restart DNA helicase PriA [Oscillatoria sp. PMC 1068.18]|nr:replication restart DNA helicase PriA [Oscillatoria sp. PMC 1076.18]MEC4987747.1 replication restart DNA helicase PriA [Oscillatoria sp. PMC 1068.18]